MICVFQRFYFLIVEVKVLILKFDLLVLNFFFLFGSLLRTLGEFVLESRMFDVVKGVYKEKVNIEVFSFFFYGIIFSFRFQDYYLKFCLYFICIFIIVVMEFLVYFDYCKKIYDKVIQG